MRCSEDNRIVLIDFGAVKEVGTVLFNLQGQKTITVVIGTPGYMSGVQGQGYPQCASDVYYVGKIAIQALTGMSPDSKPSQNTSQLLSNAGVSVSQELVNIIDKIVE